MTPINLKFDCIDNGNCRVYYKNGKRLYCFQINDVFLDPEVFNPDSMLGVQFEF